MYNQKSSFLKALSQHSVIKALDLNQENAHAWTVLGLLYLESQMEYFSLVVFYSYYGDSSEKKSPKYIK